MKPEIEITKWRVGPIQGKLCETENYQCVAEQFVAIILGWADPVEVRG